MTELTDRQRHNLELTRRAWDAYGAGDMDGVLALADPEVVIYMPSDLPNSGTFRGHEGYLTWIGNWLEAWEDFKIDVRDMEPVGERHVVTSAHQSAVGKGSGVPVEMDVAYMSEIRDGKLVALHLYLTREEAAEVAERREAEAAD
jgi:ketosteroid isomerase-like protein